MNTSKMAQALDKLNDCQFPTHRHNIPPSLSLVASGGRNNNTSSGNHSLSGLGLLLVKKLVPWLNPLLRVYMSVACAFIYGRFVSLVVVLSFSFPYLMCHSFCQYPLYLSLYLLRTILTFPTYYKPTNSVYRSCWLVQARTRNETTSYSFKGKSHSGLVIHTLNTLKLTCVKSSLVLLVFLLFQRKTCWRRFARMEKCARILLEYGTIE